MKPGQVRYLRTIFEIIIPIVIKDVSKEEVRFWNVKPFLSDPSNAASFTSKKTHLKKFSTKRPKEQFFEPEHIREGQVWRLNNSKAKVKIISIEESYASFSLKKGVKIHIEKDMLLSDFHLVKMPLK